MPFLPGEPLAIAALAIMIGGTAFVAFGKWPRAYGLGLLILLVYGLQVLAGGFFGTLGLRTDALAAGAWWQPLSYMYLHSGLLHVVGNLFILVTAGPALEDRVGSRNFLIVYFTAGFAAAAAHVALTTAGLIPDGVAVGASGAIFGILTAFAVRYPRERLPMILGFFVAWLPSFVVLLIHLALNLAVMLRSVTGGASGVAWYGHFAGYLIGLVAAVIFEKANVTAATTGRRTVPDVEPLRPLARTPAMRDMLDHAAKFTGENENDAEFANAWVDRFVERAMCPNDGTSLARDGDVVRCPRGDYRVDIPARKK